MRRSDEKLIQYLREAHATELALVTTLRAHIAMTPRGAYRLVLERHLDETRAQARRIERRLAELGVSRSIVQSGVTALQGLAGQVLSLSKGQVDVLRGHSGEEKLLKNAKDECATEALEIATYDALEALARALEDEATAELAVEHRAQEERMLARLREQIPRLTEAVVSSELHDEPTYDAAKTGAADALRAVAGQVTDAAEDATERARGAAAAAADRAAELADRVRQAAQRVPGADRVAEQVPEAPAADEEPIPGYDDLRASDVLARLPQLSQAELERVEARERRGRARKTVLARIEMLRGDEPWPGYDEQAPEEIEARLERADEATVAAVRDYERRHKARQPVIEATGRQAARG